MSAWPIALAAVLEDIAGATPPEDREADGDPIIVDLAKRLRARGLEARLGYRGVLPLVASHGSRCAVIESDSDLLAASLRESLRLRPELLKRLGWSYVRVHAFELFQDPDGVADRITELLGAPVPERVEHVVPPVPSTEETVSLVEEVAAGDRLEIAPAIESEPADEETIRVAARLGVADTGPRAPLAPRPLEPTAVVPVVVSPNIVEPITEPLPVIDESSAEVPAAEPRPITEPLEQTESGYETGPRRSGWLLSDDLDSGQV